MYDQLAEWWPVMSSPEEYAPEAARFVEIILEASDTTPTTVLELGSGGGNNALHMKRHFTMTLCDVSEGMLKVSGVLNPDCEHLQGDMRTVRLERQFDAVFIHDAIEYMTTETDLHAAIESAFVHCRPGGVAVFVPDYVKERFQPGTDHGGHDMPDGRGARYLDWRFDPDPNDTAYNVEFAILLRESDGTVRFVHDPHTCGIFAFDDWERLLRDAGFEPSSVVDRYGRVIFIAKRRIHSA